RSHSMPSTWTRRLVLGGFLSSSCLTLTHRVGAESRMFVYLADLGVHPDGDATTAIQRALDCMAIAGGGTLCIGQRYHGGVLTIRGSNIEIDGAGGTLTDTRLVIAPEAERVVVRNLTLLETRGDPSSYQIDVSGRRCVF